MAVEPCSSNGTLNFTGVFSYLSMLHTIPIPSAPSLCCLFESILSRCDGPLSSHFCAYQTGPDQTLAMVSFNGCFVLNCVTSVELYPKRNCSQH